MVRRPTPSNKQLGMWGLGQWERDLNLQHPLVLMPHHHPTPPHPLTLFLSTLAAFVFPNKHWNANTSFCEQFLLLNKDNIINKKQTVPCFKNFQQGAMIPAMPIAGQQRVPSVCYFFGSHWSSYFAGSVNHILQHNSKLGLLVPCFQGDLESWVSPWSHCPRCKGEMQTRSALLLARLLKSVWTF